MTTEILDVVVRLLAALFVGIMAYLAPKIASFIKINGESVESSDIMKIVLCFVQAADQLLKDDDPTGEKRKQYVIDNLESLGYEITDSVIAMIEGSVWQVNNNTIEAILIEGETEIAGVDDANGDAPAMEDEK